MKNKAVRSIQSGRLALGAVPVIAMLVAAPVSAQSVEQRVQRLERILDNSVLINMVQRIESLQNEVRQLRGQIEQQSNQLDSMRERQRRLYLDTDGRIEALEQGGGGLATLESIESLDSLESLEALAEQDLTLTETELGSGGDFQIQVEPVVAPQPQPDAQQEKLEYQNAYDLLILGRNLEAITGFESFLDEYPNGTYADNAHYWLGEANYVERQYNQAIDRFNVVIFQFPGSRKVPDARLRKGFSLYELQRYNEARQELTTVEAEYRGRSIAALARRRLEQMNNAGL